MDTKFQFETNKDFNKQALILMLIVIIYTAFAVYVYAFYYPSRDGWSIYNLVGSVALLILAFIEIVSKAIDICLNSRTVIIDKDGLSVTLHKTYKYAWRDLKTISIENIKRPYVNIIDSSDYNGKVLVLSSKKIRHTGFFHPYYINKYHVKNMVCVYFHSSVNHNVPIKSFGDCLNGPYLRLYEGDETKIRNALHEWGIEMTYDCDQNQKL